MAKHEKTFVDLDQPYEQNLIGMRGIVYFVIGLFLLIVVTFGLMWVFQFQVLQPDAEAKYKAEENPLALSAEERLPSKDLRLQSAPGFGVTDPKTGDWINLELREPQAEYRELQKIWQEELEKGSKDEKTGTVISLPIAEAKEKLLTDKNIKVANSETGKEALNASRTMVSGSSAGRTMSDTKR
jgi:hypothetical protein